LLLTFNHQALPQSEAFEIARENLDKALGMDPGLADAYAVRGLLESRIWQLTRVGPGNQEAESAFRRAIELNPNHASAYMWFATLRDAEERDEEAIELFRRSMELDPLARIPYTNLPLLYAQRGQYDEAIRLWLKAMEIHPEWPTPLQYLTLQLAGLGRLDEAVAWATQAMSLSNDPAVGFLTVRLYLAFGDEVKAKALLETLPDDHPFATVMEGFVMLIDSDYQNALESFSEIIDSGMSGDVSKYLTFVAAEVALVVDDLEKARLYTYKNQPILREDSELRIDKFTIPDVIRLAYISQREGDTANAQKLLRAALPVVRDQPRLGYFGQGIREVQILALQGHREDAIGTLRDLIDDGYRSSVTANFWTLENDPYLAVLREDPRFTGMVDEVTRSLEAMYDRVVEAESNGDWESLRAKAEII
jgi:tetratricopeptide (TPR) repeat protein